MKIVGSLIMVIVILALVFIFLKKEDGEEYLGFKVIGYYLLGSFKFAINQFPIPLGFLIYLFGFKPEKNIKVKRWAATFGLMMFCYGVVAPIIETAIFERTITVTLSNTNIKEFDLIKDMNIIRDEFKIKYELYIDDFMLDYDKNGEITRLYLTLDGNDGKNNIYYTVNLTYDRENEEKLSVQRFKGEESNINRFEDMSMKLDTFLGNLETILEIGLDKEYDSYQLSNIGDSSVVADGNKNLLFIDKFRNVTEVPEDNSTYSGLLLSYWGMIEDSRTETSYSAHGDNETYRVYVMYNNW